jgi:diguanylate cyclase (GGDEF)-like protein
MTEPIHPQLRRAVETRLRQRLDEYASTLEESERRSRDASGTSGLLARGQMLTRWAQLFEEHCGRVQADLVAFQAEAEVAEARAWLAARFGEHVDSAVRRTVLKLNDRPAPGLSGTAAATRFANLAATLKARAAPDLEAGIHSTAPGARPGEADDDEHAPALEMDDRLPLRRRAAFDRDLVQIVTTSLAAGEPASLVMVDLDHFKSVNDQHGHPVGDEVLLGVARLVVRRLGRKGHAYRFGGEEFALLLAAYTWEEASGLAERMRKDVGAASLGSKGLRLTASFGVAGLPDHASDAAGLLERADRALYAAKAAGRNCVRSFDDGAVESFQSDGR